MLFDSTHCVPLAIRYCASAPLRLVLGPIAASQFHSVCATQGESTPSPIRARGRAVQPAAQEGEMTSTNGTTTGSDSAAKTTRKPRQSRATRAAEAAKQDGATITPISAAKGATVTGRTTTGDNGGGRKPKAHPATPPATSPGPKAANAAKKTLTRPSR